jgi:magnesium chelatase subunit D
LKYYPFSAVIGKTALKTALLLIAIDPKLGGLLISGTRGSAKSTLARGLADLLSRQNTPFVNLPLGITEDRLLGSLNLEKVLADASVVFSEGLLAKAHGGILYVDEINLLANHLVDLLLDVSASGVNYIERDGVSHQHAAQFLLVGTMNSEEGELRPQLLDRFGLSIHINEQVDAKTRLEIVQKRLQFDNNPKAFIQKFQTEQAQLQASIHTAQQNLTDIYVSNKIQMEIATRCYTANIEGVRADLALYRAARAYAALKNDAEVQIVHIDTVEDWVLQHRKSDTSENNTATPPPASEQNQSEQQPQQEQDQSNLHSKQNSAENKPDQNSHENDQMQNQQQSEGDWGAMPTQRSPIGLQRQLMPSPKKKP